jgi:hypothetical protein
MSKGMSPFVSGAKGDAQFTLFHALCACAATHRSLTPFERINSAADVDIFEGHNTERPESCDLNPLEMIDTHVWLARKSTSTFNANRRGLFNSPQSLLRQTRADPFQCLPFPVNDLQAQLIDFYVHDYARTTLGMSSKAQPGMRYFGEVIGSPMELHALLSQSALALFRLQECNSVIDRRPLQVVALHHKGETICRIKRTLECRVGQRAINSIASIACDEAQYGSIELAQRHLQAARRMLRSIGGCSKLTLRRLILQVHSIECTHPQPEISAVFDPAGLSVRVQQLNSFLRNLCESGIQRAQYLPPCINFYAREEAAFQVLQPGSLLHQLLAKEVPDPRTVVSTDVTEVHAQLAVLVSIAAVWLHAQNASQARNWVNCQNTMLIRTGIREHDSSVNAFYFFSAQQLGSTTEMQELEQFCFSMEIMNVVRYLSFPWKVRLRNWLFRLLEGQKPEELRKLDPFAFSYMAD